MSYQCGDAQRALFFGWKVQNEQLLIPLVGAPYSFHVCPERQGWVVCGGRIKAFPTFLLVFWCKGYPHDLMSVALLGLSIGLLGFLCCSV